MAEISWAPDQIRDGTNLVRELTGIVVPPYRWPVIHAELDRLGEGEGVPGALTRLKAGDPAVRDAVFAAAAIPETYMFRHFGHFEALLALAKQRAERGLGTRVLCAGCSTGEEVWSAAAVLATVAAPVGQPHRVVGWDLNLDRIRSAAIGRYSSWACRNGFHGYDQFFIADGDAFEVSPKLRDTVSFDSVNLISGPLPQLDVFDVIFFRNVCIYWKEETTRRVCEALSGLVSADGAIFVGPSDPIVLPRAHWDQRIGSRVRSYWRRARPSVAEQKSEKQPAQRRHPKGAKGAEGAEGADSLFRDHHRDRSAVSVPDSPPKRRLPPSKKAEPSVEPLLDAHAAKMEEIREIADAGFYQHALDALEGHEVSDTVEGKLWKGILLLATEREQEAVRTFRQCVFFEPEEIEYRRWLAVAFEAAGNTTEADREYRNIEEMGSL